MADYKYQCQGKCRRQFVAADQKVVKQAIGRVLGCCKKPVKLLGPAPRAAYTAVIHNGQYIVGEVHENMAGYTPIISFGPFETNEAARQFADRENRKLRLDPKEAAIIVLTSFRVPDQEKE